MITDLDFNCGLEEMREDYKIKLVKHASAGFFLYKVKVLTKHNCPVLCSAVRPTETENLLSSNNKVHLFLEALCTKTLLIAVFNSLIFQSVRA